jgi:hypothetical protein
MEQARPDSTVLPAARPEHIHDTRHDRDGRITELLTARSTTPLPEPGSAEAKAAFKVACHEHTIRTQFANEYPELKRNPLEWWTADTIGKAMETGELTPAECARLYPLATERELRMAQIEHELGLAGLFALAYANEYPLKLQDSEFIEAGDDAELLRLGYQFEAARKREVAAVAACNAEPFEEPALEFEANEAGDAVAALAHRIADLPARTAAGFRVKLRAFSDCSRGVLSRDVLMAEIPELPDPDQILSHSLWRDVYGEPQSASEPIGQHSTQSAALSPDRTWAVAQAAAVDLSELTILQLNNLYCCFAGVADDWSGMSSLPWASRDTNNSFHDPDAAGQILDRERDRAAEIRARIAEEIRGRTPTSELERDWRLETLIEYELLCESNLRHNPELRAEMAKAWEA